MMAHIYSMCRHMPRLQLINSPVSLHPSTHWFQPARTANQLWQIPLQPPFTNSNTNTSHPPTRREHHVPRRPCIILSKNNNRNAIMSRCCCKVWTDRNGPPMGGFSCRQFEMRLISGRCVFKLEKNQQIFAEFPTKPASPSPLSSPNAIG